MGSDAQVGKHYCSTGTVLHTCGDMCRAIFQSSKLLLLDFAAYLHSNRCPEEVGDDLFKSNPHERNRAKMTQSTSPQTSVTPGFASILSPFFLHLSLSSALLVDLFASDGCEIKKTDHRCQENSDGNGGGRLWYISALSARRSVTNLSDVSAGLTQSVAHTPQTHTFLYFH